MTRILLLMAAVMAVLCCKISSGQAQSYGNAPWCAVVNQGDGEVVWDCEYQTVEQCTPNVLAGNRGFCNLNPAYVPPPGPPLHRRKHRQ